MKFPRNLRFFYILILLVVLTVVINLVNKHHSNTSISSISNTFSGSTQKADGNSVLNYYIWDDEETYIVPVVKAYNALNPSIKIKLHILASETYEDTLKKLLAKKTPIDLMSIRGISLMVQLQSNDKLLDLTPYIKNNDMDVTAYGSMFNDISVNGRYYGLPTRCTCWALYYNKKLFHKAGIDYPKQMTWNEYRKLASVLTKGKGKNKIWGGYWVPWCYNFAAIQQSSYLVDDDLSYSEKSLKLLNEFYNIDKTHMSYQQMTDQNIDCRKEFEKGNIAMMPQGEWFTNMLLTDTRKGLSNVDWDIAPMPILDGQKPGTTWGQYQFAGINSASSHPKEAFDFLMFLCGKEGARIYAQHAIIHAYSDNEIKKIYMKAVGKKSVSIFFTAKKMQEQLAIPGYEEVLEAFNKCAQEYFLGHQTIDEAMNHFRKMRQKIWTQ